jgi:trans-aconitate 2-methyltransferase
MLPNAKRPTMSWDPRQYLKYSGERLRPGFDLLAQIDELPAGPIYELGCGTGVHARAIAARWPERKIVALDNSREMLAKAAAEPSRVEWAEADIVGWAAPVPAALIFSNATLHWIIGHERLFPHLLRQLAPGGALAVQMPRNFDQPSHALMRDVAKRGPWAALLAEKFSGANAAQALLRLDPVAPPERYYDLLAPLAAELNIWETDYIHVLDGEDPVLEWVRGSSLAPVTQALPAALAQAYEKEYAAQLRQAYPRRSDGHTLLPFKRLFIVARASGSSR